MNKVQTGILLDTNIYLEGFFLSSSKNRQGLQNFLDIRTATLLLPSIVDLEVQNRLGKTVQDELSNIAKMRLSKFNLLQIPKAEELEQQLLNSYQDFINSVPYQKIDCGRLDMTVLIKKAVLKHKPFDQKGRGFQDAMIWQTLIHYLQQQKGHEIVFITNDCQAFGKRNKLDGELIEELKNHGLEQRVRYFNSLTGFLTECAQPFEFIDETFLRQILDRHVPYVARDILPIELHTEIDEEPYSKTKREITNRHYIDQYAIDGYYILAEDDKTIRLAVEFIMDFIVNAYMVTYDEIGEIEDVDPQEDIDASAYSSCVLQINRQDHSAVILGPEDVKKHDAKSV